jgi:hypothetical protein
MVSHWYFIIIMSIPVQLGPFASQEECISVRNEITSRYTIEIAAGHIVPLKCWKVFS